MDADSGPETQATHAGPTRRRLFGRAGAVASGISSLLAVARARH
jgi:hypothetical protein